MTAIIIHIFLSIILAYLTVVSGIAIFQSYSPLIFIIYLLLALGVLLTIVAESRHIWGLDPKDRAIRFDFEKARRIMIVLGVALIGFSLNNTAGWGAFLQVGLIGTVGGLITDKYDSDILAAGFMAMAGSVYFSDLSTFIFAALLFALIYVLADGTNYSGFGGRIGFYAFAACVIVALITGYQYEAGPLLTSGEAWTSALLILVVGIINYYFCVYMAQVHGRSNAFPTSIVILVSTLLTQLFLPEYTAAAFIGSMGGMMGRNRAPSLAHFLAAILAVAFVYVTVSNLFGGYGGKLGALAFLGCTGAYGLYQYTLKDA